MLGAVDILQAMLRGYSTGFKTCKWPKLVPKPSKYREYQVLRLKEVLGVLKGRWLTGLPVTGSARRALCLLGVDVPGHSCFSRSFYWRCVYWAFLFLVFPVPGISRPLRGRLLPIRVAGGEPGVSRVF